MVRSARIVEPNSEDCITKDRIEAKVAYSLILWKFRSLQHNFPIYLTTHTHLPIALTRSRFGVSLKGQLLDFPFFEQTRQNFLRFPADHKEPRPFRSKLLVEVLKGFKKKRGPAPPRTARKPAKEKDRQGRALIS